MAKCDDTSHFAPAGTCRTSAAPYGVQPGGDEEFRQRGWKASATAALLRVTEAQARIASGVVTLAIGIFTVRWGGLPAPLYALPALICGWGRCRGSVVASIIALTAAGSAIATGSAGLVSAVVVAAVTLTAIAWAARTARIAYDNELSSARFDALTGCLTLRAFHEELAMKLTAAKSAQRPVALAYIDLDHFKEVNDRYGHAVGDRLLADFANGLRARLLDVDVVGRLGGDEFAVLLGEVHGPCAVQRFERIVHDILARQDSAVTASIGALVIDPGATVSQSELIVMTDELMYEAKRSGKATVRTNVVEAAATDGMAA
jgi:diguanylate cyclase (GGDEF)-like protein